MSNDQIPLLFLDVDGVINCFPSPSIFQMVHSQEWSDKIVERYKIWYRGEVIDFINELHRDGLAEIVWLTTWAESAATELAPSIGLDEFEVIGDTRGSADPWSYNWWKFRRVMERIGDSGRRFVWLDDDLGTWTQDAIIDEFGENVLMIKPEPNPGLQEEHIVLIREWLLANNSK